MINLRKIKTGVCLMGLVLLCLLCSDRRAVGEENTVTMTEYDSSEAARQSALAGKIVTISNLKEFRLFQKHFHESEDGLAGISFRQEADITPGDYHFTYDANMDRYWIDLSGNRVGAVDRQGQVYGPDGFTASSIGALGLSDLILQNWDDATWFAGTYDGQGYFFRGFLLGVIDYQGSTFGGLFCDLKGGTIRNVNVSDCCMHFCMSPLVNAMCGGTIENCHVSNILGAAECGGGIAGLLWQGVIRGCTVEHCSFQFRQGYQESGLYGGLGGVVGVVEQSLGGTITNCQVSDTALYGKDFSQVGTGGIVGVANTSRTGSLSITDCTASVTIHGGRTAGGIIGRIQKDGPGTVGIRNCVCNGSIIEPADSGWNIQGGILGKLGPDVAQVSVNQCISQMAIEKYSEERRSTGIAGGIIGSAQSECIVDRCVFAGRIQESETVGDRGQMNLAGGIVGEMGKKGTIVNCVNFGDIRMGTSQNDVCGGLVGWLPTEENVEVVNSLTLGSVTGEIAGGLVGQIDDGGQSVYRLHNSLSLGEVTGTVAGYLAGEAAPGTVLYCYGRGNMAQAFGSGAQETEYCRQVSAEQLAGTEQEKPIFDSGEYAGILSVVEILNVQANLSGNRSSYALWENTQAGYPLPEGMEESLPFALRELDGEWNPLPIPTGTPKPSSTGTPEASETPSGTETPTSAPTGMPLGTEMPKASGMPSGMGTPSGSETPKMSAAPRVGSAEETYLNQQAAVKRFRGKSVNHKSVVLTWKKNAQASGYCIYRSVKMSSGYRKIKKCSGKATRFRDKKCKPGKRYYYQIRAIYKLNGKNYQGKASECTVKLPYLKNPTFRLSKGKNEWGERYLQITLGKYAGKCVDIYLRKEIGYYRKVPMASHKISRYGRKLRFTYLHSGVKYWCKIRTYKIIKGKKRYSGYSKVKKIRL